ncbi:LWR-salt protein [Halohasta litorea]|uniref:LWR-salt protein n=1 Tax=Halohasta litorea TaxID=869891 RepID=A0ABD6DBG7_9EURY|nr:LWR-salt protein [Halohasta litorea]
MAAYVFCVRFRLDPDAVRVDPNEFETVLRIPAADPGEEGWLFFQQNLWRGNVGDESHFRSVAEDHLGVPVDSVTFSELETDPSYLDDLESEIAADLAQFNADSVDEVLHKYLGSSIHVRSGNT